MIVGQVNGWMEQTKVTKAFEGYSNGRILGGFCREL